MADKSGFPDCTPWKDYRYPLTRLTEDIHYEVLSNTGAFHEIGVHGPMDIWLNSDWCIHGDALNIVYKIIMHSGTRDSVKTIQIPQCFINGGSGTSTRTVDVAGGVIPYFDLGTSDNNAYIDVASSLAPTIGSKGNTQSLFPMIPGLYLGFAGTSNTAFVTDNEFSFQMNTNVLDGIPKIKDNTYTCYYKSPNTAGDTVVTAPLPSGIGNKGFNILLNGDNSPPKRNNTNPSWGTTVYIEGSVDGINWVQFVTLLDDVEDTLPVQASWDSNALDGEDFPFKRIKVEFETGGTEMSIYDHQYQKMAITPH